MSRLYGPEHRALQDRFDTRRLADGVERRVVATEIGDEHKNFIESQDMFWLASIDHQGRPTVSYKGGEAGFVRVLDSHTIVFPSYDGNGMFYSMGNIVGNGQVGLLFVDFERPNRLRVQGVATIDDNDPLLADYFEAQLVVRVAVSEVFRNCPRYVHRHQRVAPSKYLPRPGAETPLAGWKLVDDVQGELSPADRARAQRQGLRTRAQHLASHDLADGELQEKLYFDLSRGASYAAAKNGELPTVRIGKKLRVPIQKLEMMLAEAGGRNVTDGEARTDGGEY